MAYSTEENVYEATGMTTAMIQSLSEKSAEQVTALINDYIAKADDKIRRLLKIPISIRKERHEFDGRNKTVELGPHEDEFEIFDYDPENCVEGVYALFNANKRRIKLPYPKDCDEKTEAHTDYSSSNCVLSTEAIIKKCGDASIKAIFSDAGYFGFPADADWQKSIYPWDYVGFWFRTSDPTQTYKLRLYSGASYNEWSFTVDKADVWYIISINLSEFDTESIDWSTQGVLLDEARIYAEDICTIYFDNFNFNDGFFWTYPEGLICWSKNAATNYPNEIVFVTYYYDPYKNTVPPAIEEASAKLAGVHLLNYLVGIRIRTVSFEQMSESLEFDADREVLVAHRNKLQKEAQEALASIGYGFTIA